MRLLPIVSESCLYILARMSDVLSSLLPPQEKLRLKWGNHKENISSVFQEFRNSGDFCDVTLVCGGHQLEAHRVILAASSAFFRDMLQRHPHPHPLVYMKGVDCKHLWSVVNFMYRGEVNISEADLASFMVVAEDLQVISNSNALIVALVCFPVCCEN